MPDGPDREPTSSSSSRAPTGPASSTPCRGFLVEHGGNIVESQQFGDRLTEPLLHADPLRRPATATDADGLRAAFAAVAERFDMDFELWAADAPYRTLIMVSKHLHCLNDLLFRASTGALQIEIPAVVSNHPDAEPLAGRTASTSTTSRSRRTPRPTPRSG